MNISSSSGAKFRCRGVDTRISQQTPLSQTMLERQNRLFRGSGGITAENRCYGFVPGFFDTETGRIFIAQFADGRPAPMHLLDGLPADVVLTRSASGRVTSVKASVIAGFVRKDRFYTREQAAAVAGA